MVMMLWCIILATPLSGQTGISYSYDSAGNRISRVTSSENVASAAETPHGSPKDAAADSLASIRSAAREKALGRIALISNPSRRPER